jgi:hypothetical protein
MMSMNTVYKKCLHLAADMVEAVLNSTSHAFRKICAPWGVIFFMGASNAIY